MKYLVVCVYDGNHGLLYEDCMATALDDTSLKNDALYFLNLFMCDLNKENRFNDTKISITNHINVFDAKSTDDYFFKYHAYWCSTRFILLNDYTRKTNKIPEVYINY